MMKRKLAAMMTLMVLLAPSAMAATREEAETTARTLVGSDAVLRESELDDGYYELEFDGTDVQYDVLIDSKTGEAVWMETSVKGARKATAADLDETAARAAVTALKPEAAIDYALLEQDDGRYVWNVFYSEGNQYGLCEVNAQTGEVTETQVALSFPQGALTAKQAVDAVMADRGEMTIQELDLELDDDTGSYRYDGTAQMDGKRYEFEVDAASGDLVKWERD